MNPNIRILLDHPVKENNIFIDIIQSGMKRIDSIDIRTENNWSKLQAVAKEKELLLFDGDVTRFERLEGGNRLQFSVSGVRFKDVMGQRPAQAIYARHGIEYLANALSVFAVVVTADDKIPLLFRTGMADFNDFWVLPCGFVYENEDGRNPCNSSRRNVMKDLSIDACSIKLNTFIGLYDYPDISETTACFCVKTSRGSDHMAFQAAGPGMATSAKTCSRLMFIDCSPEAIHRFTREHAHDTHPGTLIALQLFSKNKDSIVTATDGSPSERTRPSVRSSSS